MTELEQAAEMRRGPNTRARAMILDRILADYGLSLPADRSVRLLTAFLAGERGEALGLPPLCREATPAAEFEAWKAAGVAEFLPQARAAIITLWGPDDDEA